MAAEVLQKNNIVGGRWRVEEKIGRGGFGEIYRCTDERTNTSVALKLISKTVAIPGMPNLEEEAQILSNVQGKKFFALYHSFGRTVSFDYLVMELLGSNLKSLQIKLPRKKFSVEFTLSKGRMMLKAIEFLHEAGYLHRDIKPTNFAIGLAEKSGIIYLIDFGLSKQYVSNSGELCALKSKVAFRGTARYSSANVLQGKDAGRRDDLISLFYTLIEMRVAKLPWRKIVCRRQMAVLKESIDYSSVTKDFPTEFLQFYKKVNQLSTLQKPNYDSLLAILDKCLEKCANSGLVGNSGIIQGNDYVRELYLASPTISTETTVTGNVLKYEEFQRPSSYSEN